MTDEQKIIDRFIEQRKLLDMTQSDLAKVCGVTPSAICQIEGGTKRPSLRLFFCMAWALGLESLTIEVKRIFKYYPCSQCGSVWRTTDVNARCGHCGSLLGIVTDD